MENQLLMLSAVYTERGRIKFFHREFNAAATSVRQYVSAEWIGDAPFDRLGVALIIGNAPYENPEFQLSKPSRWLEVTIRLPLPQLKALSTKDLGRVLRFVVLDTLLRVAVKYGLDQERIRVALEGESMLSDGVPATHCLQGANTGREPRKLAKRSRIHREASLVDITIAFPLAGWGDENDVNRRHRVQTLVDEYLRDTENGYCHGGSTGSGSMEVHCCVLDPQNAMEAIVEVLGQNWLLDGAEISCAGEDGRVVLYTDGPPQDGE